jgi:hypothetical protein
MLLDERFRLSGEQRQDPRELDRKPDMLVGDIDRACGRLAEKPDAKIQMILAPRLLEDR